MHGEGPGEAKAARRARRALDRALRGRVDLLEVRHGKFAGRIIARVIVDGRDIAGDLIRQGFGRPYDGGQRESWNLEEAAA